jgi:hypothetical protein
MMAAEGARGRYLQQRWLARLGALPGELSSESSPQRGLLRVAAYWQSPYTTAASTRRVGGAGASHHLRAAEGDS